MCYPGAYKLPLAANRRATHVVAAAGFRSPYLSGPLYHMSDTI